jgi:hypothetical protein
MTTIVTPLKAFSTTGNVTTYAAPQHTIAEPRLVIQKRAVPSTAAGVAQTSVKVVYGTSDASDMPIAQRISFEAIGRLPVMANDTDVDNAIALYREIVASDEFVVAMKQQLAIV